MRHRPTSLLLALALLVALPAVASCGSKAGAGNKTGSKLVTWPLDIVSSTVGTVTPDAGGRITASAGGETAELIVPAGAVGEQLFIEVLPLTTNPLKDGEVFANGVYVRPDDEGVGGTFAFSVPVELRLTVPKEAPANVRIVRWIPAKKDYEVLETQVQPQGGRTVLTAKITAQGGYGARDVPAGKLK